MRLLDHGASSAGWHLSHLDLICPRRGALWRLGGRKTGSSATIRGELIHICMAHHYGQQLHSDIFNPHDAIEEFAKMRNEESPSPLWEYWIPMVQDMYKAYALHWIDEKRQVIAVEHEFRLKIDSWPETPGESEFLYTQRADLVYKEKGKVYIDDHKGTGHNLKRYGKEYELDGQMLGYRLIGATVYGKDFAGVRVNAIQLTDDGEMDFRRIPLPRPICQPEFVETLRFAYDTRVRLGSITDPMKVPGTFTSCMGRYGPCENWNFCMHGERNAV